MPLSLILLAALAVPERRRQRGRYPPMRSLVLAALLLTACERKPAGSMAEPRPSSTPSPAVGAAPAD